MATAGHATRQPIGVFEHGLVIQQLKLTEHGATVTWYSFSTVIRLCFFTDAFTIISTFIELPFIAGEPGLVCFTTVTSPPPFLEDDPWQLRKQGLWDGCPSCHPTISVTAWRETQSSNIKSVTTSFFLYLPLDC